MGIRYSTPLLLRCVALPLWAAGQAMAHHLPPGMEDIDEFADEPFTAAVTQPFTSVHYWFAALAVGLMVWAFRRKTVPLRRMVIGMAAAGTALLVSGFSA